MNDPIANRELDGDAAPRDESSPSLADVLLAMAGPVFAAIDGAQFDDVAALMKSASIACRSLFLDITDAEVQAAGPWLARLDTAAAIDRLLAALGNKPAAVFWFCPAGETALYRHLRTLYVVIVPLLRDEAPERDEAEMRPASDFKDTRVFFRHYDPRVLPQVLTALDEGQFMRVLGPASLVVFPAEGGGKPRRAPALDHSVVVPSGPLRLRPEQMDRIADIRAKQSRRRIASFLMEQGAELDPRITDAAAMRMVEASEPSARALGIETESGQARWAYAMMITGGKAAELPEVTRYIRSGRDSPDGQVERLLGHAADALRTGRLAEPRR